MQNFETALTAFIATFNQARKEYYLSSFSKEFAEMQKPVVLHPSGRKFAKLTCDTSVVAFVNKETGQIFKPASWKAPAKGARGSIYNEDGGRGSIGATGGIVYHR